MEDQRLTQSEAMGLASGNPLGLAALPKILPAIFQKTAEDARNASYTAARQAAAVKDPEMDTTPIDKKEAAILGVGTLAAKFLGVRNGPIAAFIGNYMNARQNVKQMEFQNKKQEADEKRQKLTTEARIAELKASVAERGYDKSEAVRRDLQSKNEQKLLMTQREMLNATSPDELHYWKGQLMLLPGHEPYMLSSGEEAGILKGFAEKKELGDYKPSIDQNYIKGTIDKLNSGAYAPSAVPGIVANLQTANKRLVDHYSKLGIAYAPLDLDEGVALDIAKNKILSTQTPKLMTFVNAQASKAMSTLRITQNMKPEDGVAAAITSAKAIRAQIGLYLKGSPDLRDAGFSVNDIMAAVPDFKDVAGPGISALMAMANHDLAVKNSNDVQARFEKSLDLRERGLGETLRQHDQQFEKQLTDIENKRYQPTIDTAKVAINRINKAIEDWGNAIAVEMKKGDKADQSKIDGYQAILDSYKGKLTDQQGILKMATDALKKPERVGNSNVGGGDKPPKWLTAKQRGYWEKGYRPDDPSNPNTTWHGPGG